MFVTATETATEPELRVEKTAKPANPDLLFAHVLNEINALFRDLADNYGETVESFDNFLQQEEPEIHTELQRLFRTIDSTIYGRYRSGDLTTAQFSNWQHRVMQWARLNRSAVQLFILRTRGEVFEPAEVSPFQGGSHPCHTTGSRTGTVTGRPIKT